MIERAHTTRRHSQSVACGGLIFLSGITAKNRAADASGQTEEIFQTIERLLAERGATKETMLSAQVWLKDIEADFAAFTALWEAWIPAGAAPARAVVEARMAAPEILVEVMVVATAA